MASKKKLKRQLKELIALYEELEYDYGLLADDFERATTKKQSIPFTNSGEPLGFKSLQDTLSLVTEATNIGKSVFALFVPDPSRKDNDEG